MKIADKYKEQGYFACTYKEKTIRKGKEYEYRAVFAIWDGNKWRPESCTKGLVTKDLADSWLQKKVSQFKEDGKDIMLNPETVTGFVEAHYKPFLIDQGIQFKYEFQKLDVICEFLGEKLINSVSLLDGQAFKTWLMKRPYKRGKGEQKRTKASAHRYLSRLRALLIYAEEGPMRNRNNHFSFKTLIDKDDEDPKTSYISFDEFMRVLDKCKEVPEKARWKKDRSHMRLTLIAGYTTGFRIGALGQVTRRMIETDDVKRVGVIRLVKPEQRNKKHAEVVEISTWLYEEMEKAGVFEMADDQKVFCTTNYGKLVKDLFKRAGVSPDVTFHTLRAANATERDTAFQDRESINASLGWSKDSKVPEKHYLRHQDYHVIEKGKVYDVRLERLRREYADKPLKETDDVLNADRLE